MARKRVVREVPPSAGREVVASLRLRNRKPTDWMSSAEGFLLLYDPSVVTDAVFGDLFGLQTVAPAALGWMTGQVGGGLPFVAQPEHWSAHDRAEMARRVALMVRLGWEGALAMLPLCVASNGADIRIRPTGPAPGEAKAPPGKARGPLAGPKRAWIVARESRLAVTWDFLLGFSPGQWPKLFREGYRVEFPWPAGSYQVSGWTLPERESDEGLPVDHYLLHMEPWESGRPTS